MESTPRTRTANAVELLAAVCGGPQFPSSSVTTANAVELLAAVCGESPLSSAGEMAPAGAGRGVLQVTTRTVLVGGGR
jgi:hypothetical protein